MGYELGHQKQPAFCLGRRAERRSHVALCHVSRHCQEVLSEGDVLWEGL